MDEVDKKDGPIGERFDKEREYFESEANKAFFKAMVSKCARNGGKEDQVIDLLIGNYFILHRLIFCMQSFME